MTIFEISTLEFVETQNFVQKLKLFKFGTKNALYKLFWDAILKAIVIFEISTINLVKLQSFEQKI